MILSENKFIITGVLLLAAISGCNSTSKTSTNVRYNQQPKQSHFQRSILTSDINFDEHEKSFIFIYKVGSAAEAVPKFVSLNATFKSPISRDKFVVWEVDPGRYTVNYLTRPGFVFKYNRQFGVEVKTGEKILLVIDGKIEFDTNMTWRKVVQSMPMINYFNASTRRATVARKQEPRAEKKTQKPTTSPVSKRAEPDVVIGKQPDQKAKEFPTTALAVNFPVNKPNPNDIAVIIGNANYEKQTKDIPDVIPAYADAESYKKYAIRSLGIMEGNIIFLKDATSARMVSIFGSKDNHKGQLFDWVRPGLSRIFVYYSGHGAPGSKPGDAYLVPVDADVARIKLNGYPLKILFGNLSKIRAKTTTLVLEACFSGSSSGGAIVSRSSGIYVSPRDVETPENITVISAGQADQIASWELDKSNGLFTKYYLTGMSGKADLKPYGNSDGVVAKEELSNYLKDTLTYQARRHYGRDQVAQIAYSSR